MSEGKKEYPIDLTINWDGGTGEIEADAFKKNLPEDLTEDHFEAVDSYRDQFAATIGEKFVEKSTDHFANSEDDLSIMEYGMGGNATLSMVMSSDRHMTTTIQIAVGDALDAVQNKAKELYKNSVVE